MPPSLKLGHEESLPPKVSPKQVKVTGCSAFTPRERCSSWQGVPHCSSWCQGEQDEVACRDHKTEKRLSPRISIPHSQKGKKAVSQPQVQQQHQVSAPQCSCLILTRGNASAAGTLRQGLTLKAPVLGHPHSRQHHPQHPTHPSQLLPLHLEGSVAPPSLNPVNKRQQVSS